MQPSNDSSSVRRHAGSVFLLTLLFGLQAHAANLPAPNPYPSADIAFARYIALQGQRDPFANSEPMAVLIETSLPDLYKSAAVVAIRRQGESQPQVLQVLGDGTVLSEVVDRYLSLRQQIDQLPAASNAITPANYKFHFGGEVKTGRATAYIYDVCPKKRRPGLLSGQLWMDSATGQEIMVSGYLPDVLAPASRIDVVRETQVIDGSVVARVTHLRFAVPRLGRAEVVVTEATPKFLALFPVEER
jgi:hypothetical protein